MDSESIKSGSKRKFKHQRKVQRQNNLTNSWAAVVVLLALWYRTQHYVHKFEGFCIFFLQNQIVHNDIRKKWSKWDYQILWSFWQLLMLGVGTQVPTRRRDLLWLLIIRITYVKNGNIIHTNKLKFNMTLWHPFEIEKRSGKRLDNGFGIN